MSPGRARTLPALLLALLSPLAALGSCSAARAPSPNEPSPGLIFPAHFAEGDQGDAGAPKSEPLPASPAVRSSDPPDPEPLRQAEQYEYTFAYERGVTRFVSVRALRFRDPVVTARKMGRFALELWVGQELVERARFDFPLLAAEDPPPKRRQSLHAPPTLTGGVLKATVLVPAAVRARRAVLLDRGTGKDMPLDWPPRFAPPSAPSPPSAPPPASASAPSPPPASSAPTRTP